MRKLGLFLINASIVAAMPGIATAAGTYYNGNLYQNPQRYGNNGGGYYNSYGAGRGYGQQMTTVKTTTTKTTRKSVSSKNKNVDQKKQGFALDFNYIHENANWNFELDKAGSKLHYDDLVWNVISGEGALYFGDNVPMQVKVGARYGKQFGKSAMIDDDISADGMWMEIIDDEGDFRGVTGTPAISAGTSEKGKQFGFNASFGLTDLFSAGRVRFTPSIGYRYLKYELTTKDNTGLMVDVLHTDYASNCMEIGGEIQCAPYVGFVNASNQLIGYASIEDGLAVPGGTASLDLGNTYYYEQAGTSHKYTTEWAGPYLALDMEYAMSDYNYMTGGIELGLPMYSSKGDQPYRIDWAHPTSVEDKGGLGDAYHLGLNAMWTTMISKVVGFSLGFTYDYYKVSKADAKTYLNPAYYQELYDSGYITDEEINSYKSKGWVLESKDEVKSVYKSMGIRAGVNIRF